MKKLTKVLLATLVAGSLIGTGVWYSRQREAQNPEVRYKLASLESGDVTQTVSANGTLTPLVLVNVGTQVSGTVQKLYVDFNDKVVAGQKMLELDQALMLAQAKQSEANVLNVSASVELARANAVRMKALFEKEYVSRQEYDQAMQVLKSAEAQLAQAKAAAEKDRVNLNYTVITSPVSGVVVARLVDIGQTVAASFQTPTLIQIAQDLSKMAIDTSFAEADIGNIKEGQKVRFTVDAFPNRSFQGEVQQIRLNPTNTQNVVTYNVRIKFDNPDLILLPGMTAYVSIAVANRKDALLVPNAALRFRPPAEKKAASGPEGEAGPGPGSKPGGSGKRRDAASGTVHILENGVLKPVQIGIGITDNRYTEVSSGDLKAGDRVVTGEALPPPDTSGGSSFRLRMF